MKFSPTSQSTKNIYWFEKKNCRNIGELITEFTIQGFNSGGRFQLFFVAEICDLHCTDFSCVAIKLNRISIELLSEPSRFVVISPHHVPKWFEVIFKGPRRGFSLIKIDHWSPEVSVHPSTRTTED